MLRKTMKDYLHLQQMTRSELMHAVSLPMVEFNDEIREGDEDCILRCYDYF